MSRPKGEENEVEVDADSKMDDTNERCAEIGVAGRV